MDRLDCKLEGCLGDSFVLISVFQMAGYQRAQSVRTVRISVQKVSSATILHEEIQSCATLHQSIFNGHSLESCHPLAVEHHCPRFHQRWRSSHLMSCLILYRRRYEQWPSNDTNQWEDCPPTVLLSTEREMNETRRVNVLIEKNDCTLTKSRLSFLRAQIAAII